MIGNFAAKGGVNDTMAAIPMLIGYEDEDWILPGVMEETLPEWWAIYWWLRRN